jgi:hypothetical protein
MSNKTQRERLLEILRGMQIGTMPLLEGCRAAAPILHRAESDLAASSAAAVVFAVESELDSIPQGGERARWDDETLHELEDSAASYLEEVREELLKACNWLESRLQNDEE